MKKLNLLMPTWEGGGNVPPVVEAARLLMAAGHRVRFMSDEVNRADAQSVGATFVPWNRAPNRPNRDPSTQPFNDWDVASPQEGLVRVMRDFWCARAEDYARDLMDELRREPADLVVTREMLPGVFVACEALGQPVASLCGNVSLFPIPGIPPIGPGLTPATTDEERALHAEVARGTQALFDTGLEGLNAARAAFGLGPLEHVTDQFKVAHRELLATSPAFDFAPATLPERVRYVGPLLSSPHWARRWEWPWAETDARPLVVVSFSTTFQNHVAVVQRVMDALSTLPVRVLVTRGGSIGEGELRPAANCKVVASAPHDVVMAHAALVVTHGGHGTTMRVLTSRVPSLIIPHGRDQNDNAVRVSHRGAGLSLMTSATTEAIHEACRRLLTEPSFKAAAVRLGDAVARDAANNTVVREIELAAAKAPRRAAQGRAVPVLA